MIEGLRNCYEALQSDFVVETLLVQANKSSKEITELVEFASAQNTEIINISDAEKKVLAETVHSQGIFCVVQQKPFSIDSINKKESEFIVIIDSGQDPGNLGTIIRTCDWFGVDVVILGKGNVELYNPKVVRSTMGSIFHLPVVENVDLEHFLPDIKQMEFRIFAADVAGQTPYFEVNYSKPLALILGNENKGIDKKFIPFVDEMIYIPSFGKAESLNLASAGAVLISEVALRKLCTGDFEKTKY
ncbi:RNA methyltransferase [candidate division KSB1 bacterium]|nr:RNA methyltransferase [candidate division KSB1 bacterium]